MKCFFATTLLFFGGLVGLQAQISSDALLLSDRSQLTTARSLGVGGAMGALGGDMSTLNVNPAGLGIYRSSEFLMAPGITFSNIRTTFVSDSTLPLSINNRAAANIGTIGGVLTQKLGGDWGNVNFGVTYSRIASFNRNMSFVGTSTGSRLVNFAREANNANSLPNGLDPFEEQLAWDAFLIDNPSGGTNYVASAIDSNYIRKSQFIRQSGGINELGISVGGNYLNKFYIGGTLGINFLKQQDIRDYSETEMSGNIDFKSLNFNETRDIKGTGINLKLGIIYRVSKHLRVGLALHTPTAYSITERFTTKLSGSVIWNDSLRVTSVDNPKLSPTGQFKHNFYSPWFANFSVGITMGKKDAKVKGFLCFDADYLDYSIGSFRLKATNTNASAGDREYINNINKAISDQYQGVARGRVGAELVVDALHLRAGYRIQTSPFQKQVNGVNDMRHDFSLGLGYRKDNYSLDIAYMHTVNQFEYSPYYATSDINNPRTINDLKAGLLLFTFGVRLSSF